MNLEATMKRITPHSAEAEQAVFEAKLKKKEQYTNRCLQQKKTKTPHYNPYE